MSQEMSKFRLLKEQSLPWQMISKPKVLQPPTAIGCNLTWDPPHQGALCPAREASCAPDGLLQGQSGISLYGGSPTNHTNSPGALQRLSV